MRREWDFVLRKIDTVFRRRINGITMPLFLPPQSFCNKNQRHQKINLAHFLLIFWKQRRVNSSFRGQNLKKARHSAPIIYKKAVPLQNDASYTPTLHSTSDALHTSRHKQSGKRQKHRNNCKYRNSFKLHFLPLFFFIGVVNFNLVYIELSIERSMV